MQPLPITGVGCISAAGRDLAAGMTSMFAGERHAAPSMVIHTTHKITYPVFEVHADNLPADYADAPECRQCGMLGVVAARQALLDAGFDPDGIEGKRVGVCLGTTVGSAMNNEAFYHDFREGRFPDTTTIDFFLRANPAAMIARAFGLTGPCQTVTNACSSGTVAIAEAAEWIRHGVCDVVIAGGADKLCRVIYNGFISLLITDEKPCRPFDRNRRGLNLGEGAGVFVMESTESCRNRGARIRGSLMGCGNGADAYHLSAPQPDGRGLRKAVTDALTASGLAPTDLAFINAHGTGTPGNDRVEGRLFAELLPGVPYLSTKGYTGHTLGAAGGIEAAFTLACLEAQQVPASIGFTEDDPDFSGRPVVENTAIQGDFALSDSLAFGGNNAAVIIGRGQQ